MHLGAFPVVVFKRPFPHSRVGEACSFQPFHFLPVLVFPVSGFQRFLAFSLAVTFLLLKSGGFLCADFRQYL